MHGSAGTAGICGTRGMLKTVCREQSRENVSKTVEEGMEARYQDAAVIKFQLCLLLAYVEGKSPMSRESL